jgi:hypothetical protein
MTGETTEGVNTTCKVLCVYVQVPSTPNLPMTNWPVLNGQTFPQFVQGKPSFTPHPTWILSCETSHSINSWSHRSSTLHSTGLARSRVTIILLILASFSSTVSHRQYLAASGAIHHRRPQTADTEDVIQHLHRPRQICPSRSSPTRLFASCNLLCRHNPTIPYQPFPSAYQLIPHRQHPLTGIGSQLCDAVSQLNQPTNPLTIPSHQVGGPHLGKALLPTFTPRP